MELESFRNIFKIKIILFTRHITDKKFKKTHYYKVDSIIFGNEYDCNFVLLLDKYPKNELLNHYSSLRPKTNKNGLNNDRLNEIKNCIINKYPNIKIDQIISGRTGKKIGERKRKNEWKLYEPLTRKNKEKGSFDYYIVKKKIVIIIYVNYTDLVECINLNGILDKFKAPNINTVCDGFVPPHDRTRV